MHLNIRSSAQVLALYLCHTEGFLSAPQSHSRCDIWPNCQVSEMPQLILDFKIAGYILVLLPTKKINLALRDADTNKQLQKNRYHVLFNILIQTNIAIYILFGVHLYTIFPPLLNSGTLNIHKHRHIYTIWCSSMYNIFAITQLLTITLIIDSWYIKFIMRLGNSKFTIMKQKSAL